MSISGDIIDELRDEIGVLEKRLAEKSSCKYPETSPCKYPGCVAQGEPGRDHCKLHFPENVAQRAVIAVATHLYPLTSRKQPFIADAKSATFQQRISKIQDEIVQAIKRSV